MKVQRLFLAFFFNKRIAVCAGQGICFEGKYSLSIRKFTNCRFINKEPCKLDVYYPKDTTNVPTIVWFHGGGLEFGEKNIPEGLLEKGVAVVAVNYRRF